MIKIFFFIFASSVSLLISQTAWSNSLLCNSFNLRCVAEMKDLVERDGLYFKKFSDDPFSGKVKGKVTGNLKRGKWYGDYRKYNEDGTLSLTGKYKNGKKDGRWLTYDRNGDLALQENFVKGVYEGEYKVFYGKKSVTNGKYLNGQREGFWVEKKYINVAFDRTISFQEEGTYLNNKKDGKWTELCQIKRSKKRQLEIEAHNKKIEKSIPSQIFFLRI